VFVSGQVVLDATDLRRMTRTRSGRDEARGVVMHELGHVVGLDHVKDRTQLMYRSTVEGVTDLGAGDLTGLDALGRGPCAPWL
jgi:predicted Zn-dependent protease